MKKIKNNLFAENGLNKTIANHIMGRASTWTKLDNDTSGKGTYDVEKITKDENGKESEVDSFDTGATNRDRPLD